MKANVALVDSETAVLRKAILVYERSTGGSAFATLHNVAANLDGPPVIGPGQCLTREAIETTLAQLLKRPQRREIVPDGVLYAGDSRVCWFAPAAVRPIFFKTQDPKWNRQMDGIQVLHPPLVFVGRPHGLAVWALAENSRPGGATQVCTAPYFNVYSAGAMCNGNARLPDVASADQIPQWERAFFETNFTHTNAPALAEGGHDRFWKLMAKAATAPDAPPLWKLLLLPTKLTLEEALNQ